MKKATYKVAVTKKATPMKKGGVVKKMGKKK